MCGSGDPIGALLLDWVFLFLTLTVLILLGMATFFAVVTFLLRLRNEKEHRLWADLLAGKASAAYGLAFLAVAFGFGIDLTQSAVCLEEITFRRYPETKDLLSLSLIAVLENLGYRQLNTYWRMKGTILGIRGRGGWGVMTRKGFGADPA